MTKVRAALFGEIAVMAFALIILDFMPNLALFFLAAGIAVVVIMTLLLKRQIEHQMSQVSRMPRVPRTPPGAPSANSGAPDVDLGEAAWEIPDIEELVVEAQRIEDLAVETLNIDEIAAEAKIEEMRPEKPYVAPSFDLFD